MILKKTQYREADDTLRGDCSYPVKPIGRPVLGKVMWYETQNGNLHHTEIITGVKQGILKSRNAKYTLTESETI